MQALENRIINGITNTIMEKLEQKSPTTSAATTIHHNTTPDLIDMTTTEPITSSNNNFSTSMPSFAMPPHQPNNIQTPLTSSSTNPTTSTTTAPFIPHQTTPSITINDLAQIISAPKEVTQPLSFPTFKSTADYHHWKQLCVLKAHKHPSGKGMTMKFNEKLIFNPHMSTETSSTLFLLTTDALGSTELIKLYGSIDIEKADGVALWKVLDKTHMSLDMSAINKEMLSKEFNELVREANETYHAFGIRFEKKKAHLAINKVPITSDPEQLALKLLLSLNEPIINQICLNLNKHPAFYVSLNTTGIIEKVKTYVKHYHLINKTKSPSIPLLPSPKKDTPKESKPKERNNDKKDYIPDTQPISEKDKIIKLLNKANDLDSYLKGLKRNDPTKFNSPAMKQACSELNKSKLYSSLLEASPSPSSTPAPAPTSPPVPTPRVNQAPPATPAARLAVQTSSTQQMINTQVQQALKDTLGDQGAELLQQLKLANEGAIPSVTVDSNNNNDAINPYVHHPTSFVMSDSSYAYCVTFICTLLSQLIYLINSKSNPHTNDIHHDIPSIPIEPKVSKHQAVIDSGATHTMTSELSLFESITYYNDGHDSPTVMLGNDSTHLNIKGYGILSFTIGKHTIRTSGLYIPELGDTTLLSVKQHMKYKGNYFHAENNNAMLAFPTFTIPLSTANEIKTMLSPTTTTGYSNPHNCIFSNFPRQSLMP
jgi:hypothetical protein